MTEALLLRFIEIVAALGAMVGYVRGRLNGVAQEVEKLWDQVAEMKEQADDVVRRLDEMQCWPPPREAPDELEDDDAEM